MAKKTDSLFRMPKDEYGDDYSGHVLEMYKLFVEMADRVSQRRQQANAFGLSITTAALGVLGFAASQFTQRSMLWVSIAVSVVGIVLSYKWFQLLRSYRDLNKAKYDVINLMERRLPVSPYSVEWDKLRGQEREYTRLSHVESGIPAVFVGVHSIALIVCIGILISDYCGSKSGNPPKNREVDIVYEVIKPHTPDTPKK